MPILKKVLIAPDKFKGSLTAMEAAEAIAAGLNRCEHFQFETTLHPLADGGEGTLELLQDILGLEEVSQTVSDPLFREMETYYLRKDDHAFVEMAFASGLQLLKPEERNCRQTTSLGTGQLIRHAIDHGCRKVSLFIGGSATNDAAMGIAAGLGCRFLDENGRELSPIGEHLQAVSKIERTWQPPDAVTFEVICDVKNPFFGTEGAAFTYAKQKGATEDDIVFLDNGLRHFAEVLGDYGQDISTMPGAGAAGGVGGGMVGLFNASLVSGIDFVMELTAFEDRVKEVDWVLSGEGKLDLQTLHGKVVAGAGTVAKKHQKTFAIFCGVAAEELRIQMPFDAVALMEVMSLAQSQAHAMENAAGLLEDLAYNFASSYAGGAA